MTAPEPLRLLAASGMLGYGFTEQALERALEMGLDLIACDGGSMDPGPYYLGDGVPFVSRRAMKRDLALLLEAGVRRRIPVVIGSCGGGGGEPHLAFTRELVTEIAAEHGLIFSMAVIHAEPPRDVLCEAVRAGRTRPLGPIATLDEETVNGAARVVAMMGVEPIQAALGAGAEVVLAGRASDAALYAALPLMRGHDPGLAWHLGKIIECAGQVVEPREGQDCVVGTIAADHFLVEPGHPDKRCTRTRIAAHTLYENPSPYELTEPGGVLDTRACAYQQIDDARVKVTGSRFHARTPYTVKLEGVRAIGHRTVFVAGVRDPVLINGIDGFVADCRRRVAAEVRALGLGLEDDDYGFNVRVYGRDAVMGEREPMAGAVGHEIGIVADVLAPDEDASRAIMAKLRYALLHTDFPGRKCISGNLAIPFSPSDLSAGRAYRFSVWHTVELDDPLSLFPMEMVSVGGDTR